MPRLTLLVGDPWIDLSALNRPLARAVAGVGALYPSAGLGPGMAHDNLAWQLDGDRRFTHKLGDWTALAAEVADAEPAEVLLNLPLTTPEPATAIAEMRRRLPDVINDICVLLYLRPHAGRIMAAQNRMLARGEGPFETLAFLDRALSSSAFTAAHHIAAWRSAVGAQHLTLAPLTAKAMQGGDMVTDVIWRAFGRAADPSGGWPRAPSAKEQRMMQIFGAAHMLIGGPSLARALGADIAAMAADAFATPDAELAKWSFVQARDIEQTCLDDAQALDDTTGGMAFVDALQRETARAKSAGAPTPALSPETEIAMRASAHAMARIANRVRAENSIKTSTDSEAA